jgi:hypothetical protein
LIPPQALQQTHEALQRFRLPMHYSGLSVHIFKRFRLPGMACRSAVHMVANRPFTP